MRRKKRKRRKTPKFKKYYKFNLQDEFSIKREGLLQKIHTEIAKQIFNFMPCHNIGYWQTAFDGIIIHYDPEFGAQAEIAYSSKLPLSKRLKIHIRLLKLLKKGFGILRAVKLCLLTLAKQ